MCASSGRRITVALSGAPLWERGTRAQREDQAEPRKWHGHKSAWSSCCPFRLSHSQGREGYLGIPNRIGHRNPGAKRSRCYPQQRPVNTLLFERLGGRRGRQRISGSGGMSKTVPCTTHIGDARVRAGIWSRAGGPADAPPYNCYFVELVGTRKYCYCFSH